MRRAGWKDPTSPKGRRGSAGRKAGREVVHDAGGLADGKRRKSENGDDQNQRHAESGNYGGGVAAHAALEAFVQGIKHNHQHAGPSERGEKWLEDAEDEIRHQRNDAVEEHVVQAAARGLGFGHVR